MSEPAFNVSRYGRTFEWTPETGLSATESCNEQDPGRRAGRRRITTASTRGNVKRPEHLPRVGCGFWPEDQPCEMPAVDVWCPLNTNLPDVPMCAGCMGGLVAELLCNS